MARNVVSRAFCLNHLACLGLEQHVWSGSLTRESLAKVSSTRHGYALRRAADVRSEPRRV